MTLKIQRTVAATVGLVFMVSALALPWLGLERFRGDTLFASLSVVLFAMAGALYFWATRPDLLKAYWIVLAGVILLTALLIHWLFR
jgi:hypothetical protein